MNRPTSEHKLRFSSSVAVCWSGRGRVSVPALPWRGVWAVTKLTEHYISVTHVIIGEKACQVSSIRKGRLICAVLNALPYDWEDVKQQREFRESVWWEWLQEVSL